MTTTTMTAALDPLAGEPAPRALDAVDLLLRDTAGMLARIRAGEDLAALARPLIVTIALGGAVFGAALGAYRGGLQVLYAAIKLPLAILLTAAICAPTLTALNAALGRTACIRRDLALVLAVLARGALVLAAEAPVVLLAISLHAAYHQVILLTVASGAAGGLVSLWLLARGLGADRRSRLAVCAALLAVFTLVGAQMSWTLRPYLVRPRTPAAPFVRAAESNFLEAVLVSSASARGRYARDAAPVPGGRSAP
ncbi:MAG TPA: hypothetical protein VGQ83_10250 [Polyangia bacterium]|jgi:hypothetical protein